MKSKVILSGMRPTGKLHLGHWVGTLSNWVKLQKQYNCFFMIADWHALMSEYKDLSLLKEYQLDNLADWLSYGIDPQESVVFLQSEVNQHLDLFMIFSALTPLGWLSRCPTFKEQIKQLKDKEVNTYAFLGYPTLQAADIALYKADCVPVGDDQLPHLELAREIIRRFHHIYQSDVFIEPKALLNPVSRLLGLDGRKMSKSYNNYIALDETDEQLAKKVLNMFTDPLRRLKSDKGHPDTCNLFTYYQIFKPEMKDEVYGWCSQAQRGCRECKEIMLGILKDFIAPHRQTKQKLLAKKDDLIDILTAGNKKAQTVAAATITQVKQAMKLL